MKTKKKPDWLVLRIVKALGINNGWSKKRAVNKEVSFYSQYISSPPQYLNTNHNINNNENNKSTTTTYP